MRFFILSIFVLCLFSCNSSLNEQSTVKAQKEDSFDFTLVFASCNDQDRPQPLWEAIRSQQPDLFVWGGDNIYADTFDMEKMQADYKKLKNHPDYAALAASVPITGVWDDHDYGINDGGKGWPKKEEAQQLFLDFLDIPEDDPRRSQAGIFTSEILKTSKGSIKLILLDTRTFRDTIKSSSRADWRYEPWPADSDKTILGAAQWSWLEGELQDATHDFTLIVSSIQFLNTTHGWEHWGHFPKEVEKLNRLIQSAKANNIVLLSGDRHMAEISKKQLDGLAYPLIDFTSSGLTHTWIDGATEGNPHRISNVIKQLNFGVLKFDFDQKQIKFEIRGMDNFLYEQYLQNY